MAPTRPARTWRIPIAIAAVLTVANLRAANADSLKIRDMPLAGDYGGRYGHTIVIDGKICRLGNSAGFSAPQGCNYEISAGRDGDETLHATTANSGCSLDCEVAPVRRGDSYARHEPFFETPRTGPHRKTTRHRHRRPTSG